MENEEPDDDVNTNASQSLEENEDVTADTDGVAVVYNENENIQDTAITSDDDTVVLNSNNNAVEDSDENNLNDISSDRRHYQTR